MASAAIPPSSEEKELALLNKQEFRIATIDSEAKLSTHLHTFLAPILLKLTSEHLSVRHKVISICQHLSVRIKPQAVQLPVSALVKQLKQHLNVPLIVHFDLVYAQQGFKRLKTSDQGALLPVLVKDAASTLSPSFERRGATFHLLLLALNEYKLPARGSKEDDELRAELGITKGDAETLSNAFGKLMLFAGVRISTQSIVASAGLSSEDMDFLTLKGDVKSWDPSSDIGLNLSATKLKVLAFLASGAFQGEERFLPALFASSDSNSTIAEQGDQILKYSVSNANIDSDSIIDRMYSIYPQSKPSVQIRLLSYLSKSQLSTRYPQLFMNVIESGIITKSDPSTGAPLAGLEISKLRSAIFGYASFYLRNAAKAELREVSQPLINFFRTFIKDQGWPSPMSGQDISLRKSAYEMVGFAARQGAPADMELLRWLFISLREDSSGNETALSITECMSNLMDAFARKSVQSEDWQEELALLLLDFMHLDEISGASVQSSASVPRRNTRYVAVRFANGCLPFANRMARWINILAVAGLPGDQREVQDEGRNGLDPHWFRLWNSEHEKLWQGNGSGSEPQKLMKFPGFEETVKLFFTGENGITNSASASNSVDDHFGLPRSILTSALQFCRALFLHNALRHSGIRIPIDQDWARKLEATFLEDSSSRHGIQEYVRLLYGVKPPPNYSRLQPSGWNGFHLLLETTFNMLSHYNVADSLNIHLYNWRLIGVEEMFTQLLPVVPEDDILVDGGIASRFHTLTNVLSSNDAGIRRAAARAYGILVSVLDMLEQNQIQDLRDKLEAIESWKAATGSEVNQTHGYIEALSIAVSRAILRNHENEMEEATARLLAVVLEILRQSSDLTLLDAALTAVAQFGMFTDRGKDIMLGSFRTMFDRISSLGTKINEKIIYTVGRLSVRLSEDIAGEEELLSQIDAALYEFHNLREIEAQFAVGEALCCVASSWDCKPLALEFDVNTRFPATLCRDKTLVRLLERTIADCKASKPSLRKASVIWLLCFVQFCGHRDEFQARLPQCQAAFMNCLSDRSELVQEAASRGLGLVYEKGGQSVKDDLVRQLVQSFTGNKSGIAGQVTADTELFDAGALPTGDGSVTTYRDILSLAAEVGNPSLVYQFMSLAASDAIWSSRAAFGKFGLTTIFEDSGMDGYLADNPKVYAKLYRFRFDPNPNVRRSMDIIWTAIVKDPSRTLDQRFDDIIEDLLGTILGREWRIREACCAAIADLIQGRQFARYEKFYADIWGKCFKVLDDIKETVRVAAMSLFRVLTNILIHNLESADSSLNTSTAMLDQVLPFLLRNTVVNASSDVVKIFSINALMDIVKKGSAVVLRPYIPELMERLVALSTDMEPGEVNYLRQRAAHYDTTEQDVDDMRVKAIRMGPFIEAVERCLDVLDEDTLGQMVPSLERAMKSAMDLPSKVTCSRIIVSLSTRRRALFKPYADRFLTLLERYVVDHNDTVASAYAAAAGYVARLASDMQILHIVAFAKNIYGTSDNDRERVTSGVLIEAIAKNAKDRFANLAPDILPFVYIAKHDKTDAIKELYINVWDDNTGGSRAVQLYLKEIVALAMESMDSPRWNLRHTAALAVADTTNALADSIDGVSEMNGEILWPALEKALSGKTWDGKGKVVLAFGKFIEKGQRYWRSRSEIQEAFLKVSAP